MRRYEFSFITKVKFGDSIAKQNFMLRCMPGNYQFQRIYDEDLTFMPEVSCVDGRDSFGNRTVSGSTAEEHEVFEYKIIGKAMLSKYKSAEELDRIFLYETTATAMSPEMKEFASTINLDGTIQEKVLKISSAVFDKLTYVSKSTDINTTAAQAFEQGKGVCQDYAQITIALLRNAGIAARYCAGFMIGEGETHAWVEYYDGSMWYGIDPTHNRIIEYGYIKISNGRDAQDCIIDRGCFSSNSGSISQEIEVVVKVGELSA